MLVLEHLALFLGALASAKFALIDRRAPLTTMPASIVFFGAFAISSFYLQVPTGNGIETTSSVGMAILGLGGLLFMVAMTILEALDKLPEHPVEQVLGKENPAAHNDAPGGSRREKPPRGD